LIRHLRKATRLPRCNDRSRPLGNQKNCSANGPYKQNNRGCRWQRWCGDKRLAEWRQQGGLSDHEVQFLQKHPEMIDFPQITRLAVSEAGQAGHERNTDGHFDFVKKAFDAHVEHLMREQAANSVPQTPTPQFFQPPPAPKFPAPPQPSRIVSAPVTRNIPSADGRLQSRGRITLIEG
jgi:hypothetical protein